MLVHRFILVGTLAGLLVGACANVTTVSVTPVPTETPRMARLARTVVSGSVTAPNGIFAVRATGLIDQHGAGVVSNNGANLISDNGGSLTSRRHILAFQAKPLVNTTVFVADSEGNPIPGIASVETDARGNYVLENVPADHTVAIAAVGRLETGERVVMQALANTRQGREETLKNLDVSLASSCVALDVLQGLKDMGDFDPAKLHGITQRVDEQLSDIDVKPMADRPTWTRLAHELIGSIAGLSGEVNTIRQRMLETQQSTTALRDKLQGDSARGRSTL